MEGRLFLNIVIRKCSAILKLFSSEDQSLLLWRDSFFVLDFGLDIGNGVIWLHIQSNRLSREGFDENLHGTTSESKDKMEGRLFLNIVIRKRSAILKLFSSKDQSLLLWRDSFFVLDFGLDVGDRVIWLDVKGDCLSSERFHKDLHGTTSKSENKMKGRFFLNIVVGKCSAIFKLFSGEDQSLLLWRDAFLVLDLCLNVGDCIVGLHIQSNRFPSKGLDKDLHGTTSKSKDKMEGRFFLNIVIGKCSAIFQLFSSEDQSLLLRRNSFFVLDFGLDIGDGVIRLDVQSNGFSRKGFDKDLHGTTP